MYFTSLSQPSVTTRLPAGDWGCETNVHGMVVQDGNLVHADRHGAAIISAEAVDDLLSQVDLIVRQEAVILEVERSPGYTVDKFRAAWPRSAEIKE